MKEVALNATMPNWIRFKPAQEWLDQHAPATAQPVTRAREMPDESDPRVQEFLEWNKKNSNRRVKRRLT